MSQLWKTLSLFWIKIQATLFPLLEEQVDTLTKKQQHLRKETKLRLISSCKKDIKLIK